MAGERRPWPSSASLDTPRRRLRRATWREFAVLLPWLAGVVAVTVWFGRGAGFVALAVLVGAQMARLAVTGTSPAVRRAGIRFVRLGTGAPPERWRLVAHRLTPLALVLVLAAVSETGSNLVVAVVLGAYLAFWANAFFTARGHGADLDPMMALVGLDVWWDGAPPTPSGTTGPPPPAPPPPTPGARATPGPAPPPARPAQP